MRALIGVLAIGVVVWASADRMRAGGPDSAGAGPPQAGAPAGGVIQSQDANTAGVVAELVECKRKDGVLSLRVRLRNTGSAAARLQLVENRNFDVYYVTAASKKYFILRDEEKVPLASAVDGSGQLYVEIPKGGSWTWWAKYPAPPDTVTKITYVTHFAPPFEDVPIGS